MAPLLLTLIAVGLIPVHLRLALRVTPDGRVQARIAWGAVSKEIDIGADKLGVKWLAGMIRGLKGKDPRPLMKLPPLVRLNLNVRAVYMRCKVGLNDAAVTAVSSGVLTAVMKALCSWIATWSAKTGEPDKPFVDVRVTPVFNHPIFDLEAGMEVHARLGKFVNLGVRLAITQIVNGINKQKTDQTTTRTQTA